jgi:hypothetical protein
LAAFHSPKRQFEYPGSRALVPEPSGETLPFLIGAALIAIAILLSSLINVAGNRFVGMDTPTEDSVWLIDRLTGNVYRCQAAERGKAACEPDLATGSIIKH